MAILVLTACASDDVTKPVLGESLVVRTPTPGGNALINQPNDAAVTLAGRAVDKVIGEAVEGNPKMVFQTNLTRYIAMISLSVNSAV